MAVKKATKPKKAEPEESSPKVSFYPGWCKRCGNCVAFCPGEALELDEWGYPHLAHPEKCISCHMCEKLCPDFALSVSEEAPKAVAQRASARPSMVRHDHSPERIAPASSEEEDEDAKKPRSSAPGK